MNLIEGVLDSLADGGESIVQIGEYLTYLKIEFDLETMIKVLTDLYIEELIYVEYPPGINEINDFEISRIAEYWFEMTSEGRKVWDEIEVEEADEPD